LTGRRWSARVTRESDALDLEPGVVTGRDPKKIAASLKRSAQRSQRRQSDPYRSALSMPTFYMNRAGKIFRPGSARRSSMERWSCANNSAANSHGAFFPRSFNRRSINGPVVDKRISC